jgi:uncharacterized SAM-binding protein YcdF (DUF218 family)
LIARSPFPLPLGAASRPAGQGQGEGVARIGAARLAWLVGLVGLLLTAIPASFAASLVAPTLLPTLGHALVAIDPTPSHVDAVAVHGGGGMGRVREVPAVLMLAERADWLVAMGGPLPAGDPDLTYAGATLRRLRELGLHDDPRVIALTTGQSTEGELRALRELAEARGWRSVALSTSAWHTRRVGATARRVFAGSGIGVAVVALPTSDLDLDRWWQDYYARLAIPGEWAKLFLLAFGLTRPA